MTSVSPRGEGDHSQIELAPEGLSWTSSCMLDPSATLRWMCGCPRARSRSKSWGTSQRAVVPIMPTRTEPATSSLQAATSETRASSSESTRRARATTTRPSSVRCPLARSTRGAPELLFEPGHVSGYVRLHRPEVIGGGGERPVIVNSD